MADAITPTDQERAGMWPEDIVGKLDSARREIGELETMNNDLTVRRNTVSHRADELLAQVIETRTELTNMAAGLTKTDSYLDRLSRLLSGFRSRIGLGPKGEESPGEPSAPPAGNSATGEDEKGS